MIRNTCYLVLSALVFGNTHAANNMIVENYTQEHGLPHNIVYCIVKDNEGFIWLGTWYGLSSFDGLKFHTYNNRSTYNSDVPPHKIQNIIESRDGNLWVKTIDHKLFFFNKRYEQFTDVFNVIKKKYNVSPKIIKIQNTDDDKLLLLTKNKDLLQASSESDGSISVELLYDSEAERDYKLTSNLLTENKSTLNWIGLDFKIISCPKGDLLRAKAPDFIRKKLNLTNGNQLTCAWNSEGFFWTGTESGKIFKIDITNGDITENTLFDGAGKVQYITGTKNKLTYAAIAGKGVFGVDEQTGNTRLLVPLRKNETVTGLLIDSYEKLWIEINQISMIYYDPFSNLQKTMYAEAGKVNRNITLCDGRELGMFILNTAGDVIHFDRSTLTPVVMNDLHELKLNGQRKLFYGITIDRDNILWLSSTTEGVYRVSYPRQQFALLEPSKQTETLPGIKALYLSENGEIWLANRDAEVYKYTAQMEPKLVFGKKDNIGNVYHFMEDENENLWLSTKGNGLILAEENKNHPSGYKITRFVSDEKNPEAIIGNDVYFTFMDSKNRIWVASFGGGLNLIERKEGNIRFINKFNSFKNYPKFGLYMEVRNITEDREGRIWVGTSDGLMSFDGNFKNPDNIKFEIYRNDKRVLNIADNDIYALFKDSAGDIWVSVFGGGLSKIIRYDAREKLPLFETYTLYQGLGSNVVVSITEDNNGNLWLATENGLAFFDKQNETFRNFDRYDGFINLQMEEESALKLPNGDIWFGNRKGIIAFNPEKIESFSCNYNVYIVDFRVSNRDLKSLNGDSVTLESIRYTETVKLKHNQSNLQIEFAALNYYNQNSVNYRYILEGYDNEWHSNGKNRIASYPNIPHGKYTFRVQAIDEANALNKAERTLDIKILPPWWLTWQAKMVYLLLSLLLAYGIIRAVMLYIRIRNEVYIEQRVSELKIRFFTNISHELRTPLTLIMGPVQELKEKFHPEEKVRQYINLIEKNAGQMLQLVNQILDFRKIQSGKMVLHVSQFDLNKLAESFAEEFMLMSEENNTTFRFKLASTEIPVWADKEKIETVLRNIISNAFKFTPAGGSITVSTGMDPNEKKCFVQVDDTGAGIPQNKINDIFDRFVQADNQGSHYYQGTGIGLALSKEIMNLHHGNISAENKTGGKGSVFTIELLMGKSHFSEKEVDFYVGEIVDSTKSTEDPLFEKTSETENFKTHLPLLLVVEDNPGLCDLLRMQLEDRYNVLTAQNGAEGMKKVNRYHPDIVVTDQMMPEMSGNELLQNIRNDFRISHTPVIILTAKTGEDEKLKSVTLGANAYITKPFNKEYLIARIDQLLNERKEFRKKIQYSLALHPASENDEGVYEKYLIDKDIQMLNKINQMIEQNLDDSNYSIDALAEDLGLSRSAFFKKVKSLTGFAPVDLIKEIRLNKSVELIKTTDLSVSEIAFTVGFKEAGYFGKCFRKKYQCTPTEYIEQYRNTQTQAD